MMLARFWRLRRMASQRGRFARWGGIRGFVGPCVVERERVVRYERGAPHLDVGEVGGVTYT